MTGALFVLVMLLGPVFVSDQQVVYSQSGPAFTDIPLFMFGTDQQDIDLEPYLESGGEPVEYNSFRFIEFPNAGFVEQIPGSLVLRYYRWNFSEITEFSFSFVVENTSGELSDTVAVSLLWQPEVVVRVRTQENQPVSFEIPGQIPDLPNTLYDYENLVFIPGVASGTLEQGAEAGQYTFSPDAGYKGVQIVEYRLPWSGENILILGVLDLRVGGARPVASDDSFRIAFGTDNRLPVFVNDTGVDAPVDPKSVILFGTDEIPGSFNIDEFTLGDGFINYFSPFEIGEYSFRYVVSDEFGVESDTATVTLNIVEAEQLFSRFPGPYTMGSGFVTDLNIIPVGDQAADLADLESFVLVKSPELGTAEILENARVRVSTLPEDGGSMEFIISYTSKEGVLANPVYFFIQVTGSINPRLEAEQGVVSELDIRQGFRQAEEGFEVEPRDNNTRIVPLTLPQFGTYEGEKDSSGAFLYRAPSGYLGPDQFVAAIERRDEPGVPISVVNVLIEVGPFNEPPVVPDTTVTMLVTDEGIVVDVLAAAFDPDGQVVDSTLAITRQPSNGEAGVFVSELADAYLISYFPNPEFIGRDTVAYTVRDDQGKESAEGLLIIQVIEGIQPVITFDFGGYLGAGTPLTLAITSLAVSEEGALDPASIRVVSDPENGTVTTDPDGGTLTYLPDSGFEGEESFDIAISNEFGIESDPASIFLIVNEGVNDSASATAGVPVVIDILENDLEIAGFPGSDFPPDPSTVFLLTLPQNGSVQIDPETGAATYTAAPDFSGIVEFIYRVLTGFGTPSVTATVTINVELPNQPPVAESFSVTGIINTPLEISLIERVSDPDGSIDTTSYEITGLPELGTLEFISAGVVRYTPPEDFTGEESFTYTVRDNSGDLSNEGMVTITIEPEQENRPPVAADVRATVRINESVLVDVLASATDPDGDELTIASVTEPGNGTAVIEDDRIRYTPAMNFTGSDQFEYTITDGREGFATAQVDVDVVSYSYSVTLIGDGGSAVVRAAAMNGSGVIVGTAGGSGVPNRGFRWENSQFTFINGISQVFGLNDAGDVAGSVETNDAVYPAVVRNGQLFTATGFGGDIGVTYAINNLGVAVGTMQGEDGQLRGFRWEGEQPVVIDNTDGSGMPVRDGNLQLLSINDANLAVGTWQAGSGQFRAVRQIDENTWSDLPHPEPSSASASVRAFSVNNAGSVTGTAETAGRIRAIMWADDNSVTLLPGLGGSFTAAYSINGDGVIAGAAGTTQEPLNSSILNTLYGYDFRISSQAGIAAVNGHGTHSRYDIAEAFGLRAVVWIMGQIVDLNAAIPGGSGWVLNEARAVNSAGQITGFGRINGQVRSFLLTPDNNTFPETIPATVRVSAGSADGILIDLLAGTFDADGDALEVVSVSGGKYGIITDLGGGLVNYRPTVSEVATDTIYYKVRDSRGAMAAGEVTVRIEEIPANYELHQNYPNPFNPSTTIAFTLPERSQVTIEIFDISGRRVAGLLNETRDAGHHEISFDASSLATAVYLYRMRAGAFTSYRKMLLLK